MITAPERYGQMDGQTDSIACCGITSLYVASRGNYGLVFYTPKIKKKRNTDNCNFVLLQPAKLWCRLWKSVSSVSVGYCNSAWLLICKCVNDFIHNSCIKQFIFLIQFWPNVDRERFYSLQCGQGSFSATVGCHHTQVSCYRVLCYHNQTVNDGVAHSKI